MAEAKGQTNKTHSIKLASSIQQVYWAKRTARAGGNAVLEVLTNYVGNNTDVKIKVTDNNGKTVHSDKYKITANFGSYEIPLPENCGDQVTAEAEISKLSLNKKSKALIVYPAIEITNLEWSKDSGGRNDVIKLKADVKKAYDGTEALVEVFEKDERGAHDLITKFPVVVKKQKLEKEWEFNYQDTTKNIPSKEESPSGYQPPQFFFRVNIGDLQAESPVFKFRDWIVIKLIDIEGRPLKDAEYSVKLADGSEKKGKLDDQGYTRIDDVPAGKFTVDFPGFKGVKRLEE